MKVADSMAAIIDRHMIAAFAEIKQKFGAVPSTVSIHVMEEHDIGDKQPEDHYAGCVVKLRGE